MDEEYAFLRTKRTNALVLFVKFNRQVEYTKFLPFEQELVDECIRRKILLTHESRGRKYVTLNRGRVE